MTDKEFEARRDEDWIAFLQTVRYKPSQHHAFDAEGNPLPDQDPCGCNMPNGLCLCNEGCDQRICHPGKASLAPERG
jgi:hypothetical protein